MGYLQLNMIRVFEYARVYPSVVAIPIGIMISNQWDPPSWMLKSWDFPMMPWSSANGEPMDFTKKNFMQSDTLRQQDLFIYIYIYVK